MKKLIFALALLLIAFCPAFSQQTSYPFSVVKSGAGKQMILFIPGFASSGDVWKETVASFEKNFTCHVLTMSGFAGEQPEANPTFDHWKTQIAQYIQDHHIDKPIIIGHSMGGALALAIAADYPQLAGKIVVVDALPCLAALMNPGFQSNPANDCSPLVDQFKTIPDEQFAQMQKRNIPTLVSDSSRYAEIINWSLRSDRTTFAKMYCDFSNTDLRVKIKSITIPSMILLEANFKSIEPGIREQYKNLGTADLRFAGKGLHFIMYDDKDWYLKQLNGFVNKP